MKMSQSNYTMLTGQVYANFLRRRTFPLSTNNTARSKEIITIEICFPGGSPPNLCLNPAGHMPRTPAQFNPHSADTDSSQQRYTSAYFVAGYTDRWPPHPRYHLFTAQNTSAAL